MWKNGICWLSRDGIETTVEETKQNSTYIVTMQCLNGQEMDMARNDALASGHTVINVVI